MSASIGRAVCCTLLLHLAQTAPSQTGELHGQASGWLTANPDASPLFQTGLRYIPDILIKKEVSDGFNADMELSLNSYAAARAAANDHPRYEWNARLYRAWLRLSTDRFEARVGLQKINFGSALLLRPLMWFDRLDPRDPLQLTDGVYGLLARYYFPDNANVWLWGLYGNNETKGWELAPTENKTLEYGGRAQSPLWTGEVGVTFHHRRADLSPLISIPNGTGGTVVPEDRLGIDGKWDIGIGVWLEAVLIRQESDIPGERYQRQGTAGADYTFPVGNGLYAATEYFRSDNPSGPFAAAAGAGFSALSLNYPVDLLDQVSVIVYRDWRNHEWYRLITWQRTYDNWSFYLLGFWNPENIQIFRSQAGANPLAGTGFQFMLIFNH